MSMLPEEAKICLLYKDAGCKCLKFMGRSKNDSGLTFVRPSRKTWRAGTRSTNRTPPVSPREFMELWSLSYCCSVHSQQDARSNGRNIAVLGTSSMLPFAATLRASAVLPCLITTVGMSSNFGGMG